MDDPTAIATAWRRIGRTSRTTAVMVYAALLQLVEEGGPARSVPVGDIQILSLVSESSVHRSLPVLERLGCVEIQHDPQGHNPSKFRHVYKERHADTERH